MHTRRVDLWKAHEQLQWSLRTDISYFRFGRLCERTSKRVDDSVRIWSPRATMARAGVR